MGRCNGVHPIVRVWFESSAAATPSMKGATHNMTTKVHYFRGKAKWAQLGLGPKPEENADKEYEAWKMNLYFDEDSMAEFRDSGIRLTIKEDDDGRYVTFRRPFSKKIGDELVKFEAPAVKTKEGEPFTNYLGNGSDVIIKVLSFDTRKGKGHRLEAVQVLEVVEYVKDSSNGLADGKLVVGGQQFVPF